MPSVHSPRIGLHYARSNVCCDLSSKKGTEGENGTECGTSTENLLALALKTNTTDEEVNRRHDSTDEHSHAEAHTEVHSSLIIFVSDNLGVVVLGQDNLRRGFNGNNFNSFENLLGENVLHNDLCKE